MQTREKKLNQRPHFKIAAAFNFFNFIEYKKCTEKCVFVYIWRELNRNDSFGVFPAWAAEKQKTHTILIYIFKTF